MKIPLSSIGVFLILSGGAPPLSAHEINVHWRISASAAQGSTGLQKFLGEVLSAGESGSLSDPADPSESPKSSIGWIQYGSGREDDLNVLPDAGGLRVMNHFYDPITRKGLSELPIFAAVPTASGPYELGTNSYIWASLLNSPGVKIKPLFLRLIPQPPHTENDWSWQNARNFEYLALTSQWQTDRDKDLARTFRALGQVIHLLQDASQPQHTRNEQHLPILPLWKSPIETYGSENIGQLKFSPTPSALDWRAAGFQKMEDFWDRHSYAPIPGVTPSVVALEGDPGSGNPGPGTLGLAEFVNGNFLGARHVYRELMTRGITGYYEYPSLNDGTDWLQIKAHPADYKNIGTIPRKIGSVNRFSIWKNAQGAQVVNHSASHFLPAIGRNNPGAGPVLTIDDPEVKKNYHDILIPKAVQYSAGLLDYFFRGRMEVWMGASSTPGNNRHFNCSMMTPQGCEQKSPRRTLQPTARPWPMAA